MVLDGLMIGRPLGQKGNPRKQDLGVEGERRTALIQKIHKGLKWTMRLLRCEKTNEGEASIPTNRETINLMSSDRRELYRTGYGLDMGVILAAFGHLPRLSDATDSNERNHWILIAKELLAAFLRTLPIRSNADDVEWHYDVWSADEKVFELVAARLFECSEEGGRDVWQSILRLPPAAHHHIEQFLNAVLLEAVRTDPPKHGQLMHIWISFAGFLADQDTWAKSESRGVDEVWKVILLFGSYFTSTGDAGFAPLVRGLAPHYKSYVARIRFDSHRQGQMAAFLTTEAAAPIFIDMLEWFYGGWKEAESFASSAEFV